MRLFCGVCLLGIMALAPVAQGQIGQYPPGQIPPVGGDPNDPNNPNAPNNPNRMPGAGGMSIPHRHKKSSQNSQPNLMNTIAADGFATTSNDKKLVVVVDDGRTLTMTVDAKTAFTGKDDATIPASKIEEGTFVHVVAAEDDEMDLTAVTVKLLRDAGPRAPGEAPVGAGSPNAQPVDPKVAAELAKPAASDAPDRPILQHGRREPTNIPRTRRPLRRPSQKQRRALRAPRKILAISQLPVKIRSVQKWRGMTNKLPAAANGRTLSHKACPIIWWSRSLRVIRKSRVLRVGTQLTL